MTRTVQLTKGYAATVDDDDYERLVNEGSWCASEQKRRVYAVRGARHPSGVGRTVIPMHGFLTGWAFVDHINGDGLDNRRANLRPATKSQNTMNSPLRLDSTSGFRGVSFTPQTGRWRAVIKVNYKRLHIGYFDEPEDAARAFDAAARIHHGEFARLNFPQETPHD